MNFRKETGTGILVILLSTISFSAYNIVSKYVVAGGASVTTILFFRFSLAALIFWAITLRKGKFPVISKKMWFMLFLTGGIIYASQSAFFLVSVSFVPASLAVLLLFTHPILVTIISVIMRQERLTLFKILGLVFTTAGLVLVLGISHEGGSAIGIIFGLCAAALYSVYIVTGSQLLKTLEPLVGVTVISTAAAISFGIVGYPIGFTLNLSFITWLGIVGLGLLSVLAILTIFTGIQKIGASTATIISSLEPVITVLLAFVFLGEEFTMMQEFGGILVVLGGMLAVIKPRDLSNSQGLSKN